MRSSFILLVVLLLFASGTASADGDAAESSRVWSGYLWRDGDGRIQIGWPVIAMGVMQQPDHVVVVPEGDAWAPLLSSIQSSYVFWNYTLEKPLEEAIPHLPRVLVQVKGPVAAVPGDSGLPFHGGERTMKPAKLVSVEFVDSAWLGHWATVFREPASPWRIRERPPGDEVAQIRVLAPKVLAALRAMRGVPGVTDAQRRVVRQIDADTKVVTAFRQKTEQSIQRWLLEVTEKHAIGLEGLDALGPLPPSHVELQRWFLASASKAAFLEKVAGAWSGDLDAVTLTHYVMDGDSTVWTQTTLDVVSGWDDDTYAARREITQKTLGG